MKGTYNLFIYLYTGSQSPTVSQLPTSSQSPTSPLSPTNSLSHTISIPAASVFAVVLLVMLFFSACVCLRKKLHKKQSNTAGRHSPEYINAEAHPTSTQAEETIVYETICMRSMEINQNTAYGLLCKDTVHMHTTHLPESKSC